MQKNYDDTFLARWLAKELTLEELQEFEASEDFSKYQQIIETLNVVDLPEFNVDENYQKTLNKLNTRVEQRSKSRKLISILSYSAAASIALLILAYNFFFSITTYQTELAQKTNFKLPDNSEVDLNAASKISFKKYNWEDNRVLNLEGEAFFKVQKGSKFTVQTPKGNVSVLGTQFKVNTRENVFHITCFEGKVLVISKEKDSIVLTQNKSFRILKNKKEEFNINIQKPSWLNNETRFVNMPLKEVLKELERQLNITIIGKQNVKNELFTGSFSHKNPKIAIQSIFTAMEINYIFDKNGNVVIKNN